MSKSFEFKKYAYIEVRFYPVLKSSSCNRGAWSHSKKTCLHRALYPLSTNLIENNLKLLVCLGKATVALDLAYPRHQPELMRYFSRWIWGSTLRCTSELVQALWKPATDSVTNGSLPFRTVCKRFELKLLEQTVLQITLEILKHWLLLPSANIKLASWALETSAG